MQKKERIIRSFEKLEKEHKTVQREITELEQQAHSLVLEQRAKAAKVEPEAMDGVIGTYQKKIEKIKSQVEGLRVKKEALEMAMKASELEFKANELRVLRKEYEFLKLESAKVRKEKDEAEKNYHQLERRVDEMTGRRITTWEKIQKLESELKKATPKPSGSRDAESLEGEYLTAQNSVFKEWDSRVLDCLKRFDHRPKRLEELKMLERNYQGLLRDREAYFGKPLTRPDDRPGFQGMSIEQISQISYEDALKRLRGVEK
jgi:chromosome segregation ATPase